MKKIKNVFYCTIVLLVSSYSNAAEKKEKEKAITEKSVDICSITYTVRENVGGTVTVSEYTITATTCEEVESAAIAAGIIKAKTKSLSAN